MKRLWPESTTARLALLFAAVAIVTFAGLGRYLHYSLAKELERHDDLELIGKVELVRHLLEQLPSPQAVERDKHLFLDAVVGHHGLVLELQAGDGRALLRSGTPSTPLPVVPVVSLGRNPTFDDLHDWSPAEGAGRTVRALGRTQAGVETPVQITLGLESEERNLLLKSYTRTLVLAVTAGALLVALLGYFVTHLALRAINIFAAQANSISASRLQSRLPSENVPSEFRTLAASFNAMFDRLEEGVQRLSNFAAELAHDLRTPIHNLMVQTQVALSKPRTVHEYQLLLESDIEEYERLSQMIENTLFLARAESAQLAVQPEQLRLQEELIRIGQYFEGLAEEAGIQFTVDNPSILLLADPVLFRRAVSNLVANAVRYTPHGGSIHIGASKDGDTVEVSVCNSGSTIPPGKVERIFERYYRVDPARSGRTGSAGLGLAIVRTIMKLHGGEVTVKSEAENTVFTLSFYS